MLVEDRKMRSKASEGQPTAADRRGKDRQMETDRQTGRHAGRQACRQ